MGHREGVREVHPQRSIEVTSQMSSTTAHARRQAGSLTRLHEHLTDAQLSELRDAIESARGLVEGDAVPPFEEIYDFDLASSALRALWSQLSDAMGGERRATEVVCEAKGLEDLLAKVGRAEHFVTAAQVRSRDQMVRVASQALARLQDVTAVPRVIQIGAETVCGLGFDRAIVSRLNESTWVTESVYVDGDSEWAAEIVAAGREHPQSIVPGLPEQDIIRRRRPILVSGVQQREAVHRAVADASQSRSYVAAPIMPRSQVIGFLHGDRFFHRGDVTQFDCDLLGMFAHGYGFALERAMLLEQLDQVRETVNGLAGNIEAVTSPTQSPWSMPAQRTTSPSPVLQLVEDARDDDSRLTRREVEVLRLMAAGETNGRIASKLIISEGTVKSHVKHILRKLGAANRAEAVAKWHHAQTAAQHRR